MNSFHGAPPPACKFCQWQQQQQQQPPPSLETYFWSNLGIFGIFFVEHVKPSCMSYFIFYSYQAVSNNNTEVQLLNQQQKGLQNVRRKLHPNLPPDYVTH
jgi:hypothetical protein